MTARAAAATAGLAPWPGPRLVLALVALLAPAALAALAGLAALAMLAGCDGRQFERDASTGALQTRFPGMVSAGGLTSGTVMAAASAASGGGGAKDMAHASREAGTPGIPQGSGGNTGGAQMGGTTGQSALSNTGEQTAAQRTPGQDAPGHAAETGRGAAAAGTPEATTTAAPMPAASAAALEAAKQKQQLDARMTLVAARWQQRAAQQGWPVNAVPAVDPASAPTAVRSEKFGTAAPSRDVKQPQPTSARPAVAAPSPASAASR